MAAAPRELLRMSRVLFQAVAFTARRELLRYRMH